MVNVNGLNPTVARLPTVLWWHELAILSGANSTKTHEWRATESLMATTGISIFLRLWERLVTIACLRLRKEWKAQGVWSLVNGSHSFSSLLDVTEFKEAPGLVNKSHMTKRVDGSSTFWVNPQKQTKQWVKRHVRKIETDWTAKRDPCIKYCEIRRRKKKKENSQLAVTPLHCFLKGPQERTQPGSGSVRWLHE